MSQSWNYLEEELDPEAGFRELGHSPESHSGCVRHQTPPSPSDSSLLLIKMKMGLPHGEVREMNRHPSQGIGEPEWTQQLVAEGS